MTVSARALVFAYHNVGVRGLSALLAQGVQVPLVVTHSDDPNENRWFGSVAELAERYDIQVIRPTDPNTPEVLDQCRACRPEFIFSFYYRHMLGVELLGLAERGAYNLHGSLLPKYRGRVPVNWAVLHGESETGASLHRMVAKPDAGDLVDQEAVPILPNDTAFDVFQKVTCAAEILLMRRLPKLLAGTAVERPLDLRAGSYFGGRRPEDGRIPWSKSAWEIHNLIRAVAPPYPGAFTDLGGHRLWILGSFYRQDEPARSSLGRLYWEAERCYVDCLDGHRVRLTRLQVEGRDLDRNGFRALFGAEAIPLGYN